MKLGGLIRLKPASSVRIIVGSDVGEEGSRFARKHVRYPFAVGDRKGIEAFEFSRECMGFESRIVMVTPEPLGALGELTFFLCG
ncbi:MAG: hypothetical protein Q7S76_03200 [bacterium]|nr:hypothetical protein [bacterium]